MHPASRTLFDGLRFSAYGGQLEPSHGGARVIDMQTVTRPADETFDEIRRERAQHATTIDAFHQVFYASQQTHGMTYFEGVPILKNPLDLWVAQEIIWDLRPTLIVETGTAFGGSALWYGCQLDRLGAGHVISIDLDPCETLPSHPRVTYVRGDSTDRQIVDAVVRVAKTHPRVMVVLDSDHSAAHVLAELEAYAPLVTDGQFLVVEDTNLNGRPVQIDWKGGAGPGIAVDAWLPKHAEFERAAIAERYMMTFHTWLRKNARGGGA